MHRTSATILLHLLLLLVTLSPLRAFAMPQMSEPVMNGCEQMQPIVRQRDSSVSQHQHCDFCQKHGCEHDQCNMTLCGAFHAPVAFLAFSGPSLANRTASTPLPTCGLRLPDRTEPPLIRPPIAFHS